MPGTCSNSQRWTVCGWASSSGSSGGDGHIAQRAKHLPTVQSPLSGLPRAMRAGPLLERLRLGAEAAMVAGGRPRRILTACCVGRGRPSRAVCDRCLAGINARRPTPGVRRGNCGTGDRRLPAALRTSPGMGELVRIAVHTSATGQDIVARRGRVHAAGSLTARGTDCGPLRAHRLSGSFAARRAWSTPPDTRSKQEMKTIGTRAILLRDGKGVSA